MKHSSMIKFATASVFTAFALGLPAQAVLAQEVAPERADREASRRAERAERFMQAGKAERAVDQAEQAVAFAPQNPAYRVLLGQAYIAAGRFVSAESSFMAARQLGAQDARTIIGEALAMIANGQQSGALSLIDTHADILPASDYGLALALAGQPDRGGMVLTEVVRSGGATARDRQNLALVYAILGRWMEARLIAGQDLGPQRVGPRIEQWAAMLQAPTPAARIAGLLGTEAQRDEGMPVRLALQDSAPVATASETQIVDPAPVMAYAPPPPSGSEALVEMALQDAALTRTEESVPASWARVESAVQTPVPETTAPAVQTAALNDALEDAPVTAALSQTMPAPRSTARTTGWAVQLGAYSNLSLARADWGRMSARHRALSGYDGVSTRASVNGRSVFRLQATGFESRAAAQSACATVRRAGGQCFVRMMARGEQLQWASREMRTHLASR